MNAMKSCSTALFVLLLALLALPAQAQRAYEPALPTFERLDDVYQQDTYPHNDSLYYFSAPGQRLARVFSDGFESGDISAFDFDGNGTSEIVMIHEDDQGNPDRFVVYDVAQRAELFTLDLTLPDYAPIRTGQMRFEGFHDYLSDGSKDVTFGGEGVILVDPEDTSHPIFIDLGECRFMGVGDFNGDDKQDLVLRNVTLRRIEIRTFYRVD